MRCNAINEQRDQQAGSLSSTQIFLPLASFPPLTVVDQPHAVSLHCATTCLRVLINLCRPQLSSGAVPRADPVSHAVLTPSIGKSAVPISRTHDNVRRRHPPPLQRDSRVTVYETLSLFPALSTPRQQLSTTIAEFGSPGPSHMKNAVVHLSQAQLPENSVMRIQNQ